MTNYGFKLCTLFEGGSGFEKNIFYTFVKMLTFLDRPYKITLYGYIAYCL